MSEQNKEYLYQLVNKIELQQKSSFKKNVFISIFIIALTIGLVLVSIWTLNEQKVQLNDKETTIFDLNNQNIKKDKFIIETQKTLNAIESEIPKLSEEAINQIDSLKAQYSILDYEPKRGYYIIGASIETYEEAKLTLEKFKNSIENFEIEYPNAIICKSFEPVEIYVVLLARVDNYKDANTKCQEADLLLKTGVFPKEGKKSIFKCNF